MPRSTAWRFYYTGHAMRGDVAIAVSWVEQGWDQGDRWQVLAERAYPTPYTDVVRANAAYRDFEARKIRRSPLCPGPR